MPIISCEQKKQLIGKGEEQIDSVCDSVMQKFTEQHFPEAFDLLRKNSVLSPASIDTLLAATTRYTISAFPAYGKIRSYDFISEHRIKDIITKRFYILKFDNYYLKFDFTLYNNGNKWTITSFAYNEDLIELLY